MYTDHRCWLVLHAITSCYKARAVSSVHLLVKNLFTLASAGHFVGDNADHLLYFPNVDSWIVTDRKNNY